LTFEENSMSESPLEPTAKRLIVLPDEAPGKVGNIILPDSAKVPPSRGTVLAVGKDMGEHWTIKPGDRVVFGKYDGIDVECGKVAVKILFGDQVLAKIPEG
jgi:co-chaperonin GroES (HSP10)